MVVVSQGPNLTDKTVGGAFSSQLRLNFAAVPEPAPVRVQTLQLPNPGMEAALAIPPVRIHPLMLWGRRRQSHGW